MRGWKDLFGNFDAHAMETSDPAGVNKVARLVMCFWAPSNSQYVSLISKRGLRTGIIFSCPNVLLVLSHMDWDVSR